MPSPASGRSAADKPPFLKHLAFSTNAFKKTDLPTALAQIAEIGYRGVEIMADLPHVLPIDTTQHELDELRERIAGLGLRVSNVNGFTGFFGTTTETGQGDTYHPTWIEHDRRARQLRVEHTISCIRLADAVGARTLSLQPGGPTIGLGLSREEAMERFAHGLRKCLGTAREHEITLGIEPEPGLLLQTAHEFAEFKERHFADEPLVKMNCDLGHHFCVDEDPATILRQYADVICHVHLEDIAASRVHQHLVPGDGAMDFDGIFATLADIGYDGWVTVELYPFEIGAQGVAQRAWDYLHPRLS